MSILQLASEDVIKIGLTSQSHEKPDVLRELVQILVSAGKINDLETVLQALLKRESLQSTGLESGIAVPHAKTPVVSKLTLAIGISKEGINFDAIDKKPSHLFFLLLSPPDKSGPHIGALAEIARLSTSKDILLKLKEAATTKDVIALLKQ